MGTLWIVLGLLAILAFSHLYKRTKARARVIQLTLLLDELKQKTSSAGSSARLENTIGIATARLNGANEALREGKWTEAESFAKLGIAVVEFDRRLNDR
jgi:hypothetical protein